MLWRMIETFQPEVASDDESDDEHEHEHEHEAS
jgi:hypothetical protein